MSGKRRVRLTALTPSMASQVREMTFPSYRPLLDLTVQPRHAQLRGVGDVQPFGFVAEEDGQVFGLALAERPVEPRGAPAAQLLSVYVAPVARRRGLGEDLVSAVEREAERLGARQLEAVFTTGKPGVDSFLQLAARRGWETPRSESVIVHFQPREALASVAFEPRALRALGREVEVFAWSELTDEEDREMRRSNRERRWIEPALEPWQFDRRGLDASSFGARHRGRVAGWVLNHRFAPGLVRFSVMFMRADLARRGKVVPLLHASLRQIERQTPGDLCSFITTRSYPRMRRFIERRIAPFARFIGESQRSKIVFRPALDAAPRNPRGF